MVEPVQKRPKLKVPYAPSSEGKGHYSVNTMEEKIVSEYAGYDFDRLDELEIFEFWLLLRDAVVYNCKQTEEGRDYLKKCWLAEQSEPDRDTLRKFFGKGG
jgi:hypothetical protein